MRKNISLLLIAALLLCLVPLTAIAETIRVPIDLNAMDTEELLALANQLSGVLSERGYSLMLENTNEKKENENDNNTDVPSETTEATEEALSLSEGATELSDETFLEDLSSGLCARWDVPDQDTSLLSDKQMVEYYTKLVNAELSYVSKYAEYTFVDEKLGDYAQNYITALQSQFIAITEYFGKDEKLYNEYWSNGYILHVWNKRWQIVESAFR